MRKSQGHFAYTFFIEHYNHNVFTCVMWAITVLTTIMGMIAALLRQLGVCTALVYIHAAILVYRDHVPLQHPSSTMYRAEGRSVCQEVVYLPAEAETLPLEVIIFMGTLRFSSGMVVN